AAPRPGRLAGTGDAARSARSGRAGQGRRPGPRDRTGVVAGPRGPADNGRAKCGLGGEGDVPMNRVLSIARIHSITWIAFVWPPAIMATSFLINLALFAAIPVQTWPADTRSTGGIASIYIVQLIVASQMVTQFFSFTAGLGATRRAFYLGTGLVVLAQSLVY